MPSRVIAIAVEFNSIRYNVLRSTHSKQFKINVAMTEAIFTLKTFVNVF